MQREVADDIIRNNDVKTLTGQGREDWLPPSAAQPANGAASAAVSLQRYLRRALRAA